MPVSVDFFTKRIALWGILCVTSECNFQSILYTLACLVLPISTTFVKFNWTLSFIWSLSTQQTCMFIMTLSPLLSTLLWDYSFVGYTFLDWLEIFVLQLSLAGWSLMESDPFVSVDKIAFLAPPRFSIFHLHFFFCDMCVRESPNGDFTDCLNSLWQLRFETSKCFQSTYWHYWGESPSFNQLHMSCKIIVCFSRSGCQRQKTNWRTVTSQISTTNAGKCWNVGEYEYVHCFQMYMSSVCSSQYLQHQFSGFEFTMVVCQRDSATNDWSASYRAARKCMDLVRTRKGLPVERKLVAAAEKQRTRSRRK